MSWHKHFQVVNTERRLKQALEKSKNDSSGSYNGALGTKYSNLLPEVYAGHPYRIERYTQYDQMDMDSEVNTALDIIADFCTQKDENTGKVFDITYDGNPSDTEVEILKTCLEQWSKVNEFKKRVWRAFRSTLKYGDQFFIRDPETLKWFWVEQTNVEKVIVNEADGKEPEAYLIKNLNINNTNLTATQSQTYGNNVQGTGTNTMNQLGGIGGVGGYGGGAVGVSGVAGNRNGAYGSNGNQSLTAVDASHVIHLSLSEGLDANWPFGTSILESVFKVFRQKELLEDAVVIYRIVRAPERRVFYIDVGQMPPHKAGAYLEKVKNEMHQKRIPNRNGGGNTTGDTAYSAMSMVDDFYMATSSDGRGSKIDTLPGGECLALDTKIKLLDGRDVPLNQLIEEFNKGIQNWVYSANPETGEIVPGPITWAGVTRKNAQVVKLTFDNGESVVVTPDHKFPILGKGNIEAQNLEIGESMIPGYFREEKITPVGNSKYTQVFDNASKKWKFVHRIVATYLKNTHVLEHLFDEKFKDEKKNTVHHVDFNRFNNNPENLVYMHNLDHFKLHSQNYVDFGHLIRKGLRDWYDNLSKEEYLSHCNAISDRIKDAFANMSPESREERARISKNNFYKGSLVTQNLYATDPIWTKARGDKASISMKELFIREPERKIARTEANLLMWQDENHYDKVFENQKLKFDKALLDKLEVMIDRDCYDIETIIQKATNDVDFMNYFREINKNLNAPNRSVENLTEFTDRHLGVLLEENGYEGWRSYRDHIMTKNSVKKKNCKALKYDPSMIKKIIDLHRSGVDKYHVLMQKLNSDEEFMNAFNIANSDNKQMKKSQKSDKKIFSFDHLTTILNDIGYDNYRDFKKKQEFHNHRLVSIEWLDEKIDTGCITVDGLEILHNYHTMVLSCGIVTFQSLGQIDDLRWFTNKLIRGMRVPSSYLPTGPEDGQQAMSDGRAGTAYIQEYRFAKYCERLQTLISPTFDKEFKLFVKQRGFNIDSSLFELEFTTPQHFSDYARAEKDSALINVFTPLTELPFFSKRWLMINKLGMTEAEIAENEEMWRQENPDAVENVAASGSGSTADSSSDAPPGLESMGIRDTPDTSDDAGDDSSPLDDTSDGSTDSPISGAEAGGDTDTGATQ